VFRGPFGYISRAPRRPRVVWSAAQKPKAGSPDFFFFFFFFFFCFFFFVLLKNSSAVGEKTTMFQRGMIIGKIIEIEKIEKNFHKNRKFAGAGFFVG